MKHYATGARFDRATGQGWLTEVGYSATSLSQGLSILTREGKVKVVGRGLYEFVSKTGEQPVKRKVKMKKSAIRVAKAV